SQHVADGNVSRRLEVRKALRLREWRGTHIIARTTDRVEHRLARRQKAEPIGPAVIIRAAIGMLPGQLQIIRSIIGGSVSPFVCAILSNQQPSGQGMDHWAGS